MFLAGFNLSVEKGNGFYYEHFGNTDFLWFKVLVDFIEHSFARYLNSLDPSLKWGGWTEEEDLRLEAAITKYGYCWSKVAEDVPPRTDSQCRKYESSLNFDENLCFKNISVLLY